MNTKKLMKKIIILLLIIGLVIFFVFLYDNKSKKIKSGNTMNSQEIVENILNISSYEVLSDVEIKSNKNINKYVIKQKYIEPDVLEQEILEPENIQGIKITKKENELTLENTRMNISKIYNHYKYMTDNCMDLITFINEYKNKGESIYEENENEIILNVENNTNAYIKYRTLYISKETRMPTRMEIKDDSKKTLIYILYREVKFNK